MRLAITRLWDGSPAEPGEGATIALEWGDPLVVRVDAPWHGDPPPSGPPGPRDALWEHEVVELFLVGPEGSDRRYTEVELGPHGHHLVLQLEGIRRPVADKLAIDWAVAKRGERWVGEARIPVDLLPDPVVALNGYAIHGTGAARRYLAWAAVPGDAPDFHRLAHFPSVDSLRA